MSNLDCIPYEEFEGFGTLLQFLDPISDEWNTVGGTEDLETPEDTTEEIEASPDPVTGYARFVPSKLASLGALSLDVRYRTGMHAKIRAMKANKTITAWRIVLPTADQEFFGFCAFISSVGSTHPERGLSRGMFTLRPTGAPDHGFLNA